MAHNGGIVTLTVAKSGNTVSINIRDDGKGMPKHILERLGEQGLSFGKSNTSSGAGLGVYHAKKTIIELNGTFIVNSEENKGTEIKISLPSATAPDWFTEALTLPSGATIVIVDDQPTIHSLWKEYLRPVVANFTNVKLFSFTSGSDFKIWYRQESILKPFIYLIDYEFFGQNMNGLDIIEELGIQAESYLVTSRYEELVVRQRCEKMGVRLIPKEMIRLIPIKACN